MTAFQRIEPLPPFESGASIVRRLAGLYRPKAHLTVSEWAERHIAHYDPDALPYLAEIMDACSDPETAEVGDMGPAQAGKSLVGEAFIGWSIDHDPADFLVCQPDKSLMQDFVIRRLNPLIANTPALKNQLLPAANADNIFLKQFRGMLLTSIWPVGSQFRARPIPRGWLDDYDQYDDDIEGQGSAIKLLDGRQTTFEGRDTKLISSSPAREDGGGIEAFVASGTDERLMPVCPQCEERIELDIRRDLHFDGATPEEAEGSAHVVCPANGCVLEPSARRLLLDSTSSLPNHGFVARHPERGRRRRTFRRDGLLAFSSWGKLAREWKDAQLAWETRQDESELKSFFNVKGGQNYRSQLSGEKPLDSDALKLRREKGFKIGTVPAGVKVLVTLVDVQSNRVEKATIGWGDGLESWVIDRRSIDVLDDGLTPLAPFTHPEHSAVLLRLFNERFPLADGSGMSPPPLAVALDIGGGGMKGEGATEFAKSFWEAARALGIHKSRITLIKGGNNPNGELMPRAKFADQKRRGGAKRTSAELWMPNVHRIKNTIDARLRRTDPGPGYIHLPGGKVGGGQLKPGQDEGGTGRLLDHHVDEITAEQLQKGKWVKVRPRNETWDLLVYGYAAILRPPFAQSRTHMRWVPADFRVKNQVAAPADAPTEPSVPAAAKAPSPPAAPATAPPPPETAPKRAHLNRKTWVKPRRGNWLDRRR